MKTTQDKYPPFFRLSNGSSKYGAQMGRRNILPDDTNSPHKLYLRRLPMSGDGVYDAGGAYWGIGNPLWIAAGEDDKKQFQIFIRARSRGAAKLQIKMNLLPEATFYR